MTRIRGYAALAVAPLVLATSPLGATGLGSTLDDVTGTVGGVVGFTVSIVEATADTLLPSPNVTPVGLLPEPSVISVAFASDAPLMYASTLTGIRTYDISDPRLPRLLGAVPMALFQNENVKLGERADGTKFVLVGFDSIGVTPTEDPTDVGTYDEIVVVDVTDPASPYIRSRVNVGTDTHTVGCANRECTHAYSSGRGAAFDVVDLTDLDDPVVLDQVTGQPMEGNAAFSTGIGHDWDVDADEVTWWVGTGGIVGYDVTDPTAPVVLNSSDVHGRDPAWNNFISHNSLRPNADDFTGPRHRPGKANPKGNAKGHRVTDSGSPHVDRGNVLLVTEEDYIDTTCASEGSFQTWHVPDLDPTINPDGVQDGGTITPLDQWNTELLDTGVKTPAGAFCSAHYFDYHQDGYVAQGWYQQGLRILDVNDPTEIRQVGFWITGVQETWGAKWVPEYDADGHQTGRKTNLVYTQDPTRGMEILEVDMPAERGAAPAVTAPVLQSWLTVNADLATRAAASPFGGACVLPPATRSD
ncbi:hypothetical protein [Egicoccus sp. AB-alg2]|uniref:hypothetical protein n=1 Tax=Egicoccus sp. AB-alg2 TaxID=3242693 RepID=UPI00359EF1D2